VKVYSYQNNVVRTALGDVEFIIKDIKGYDEKLLCVGIWLVYPDCKCRKDAVVYVNREWFTPEFIFRRIGYETAVLLAQGFIIDCETCPKCKKLNRIARDTKLLGINLIRYSDINHWRN